MLSRVFNRSLIFTAIAVFASALLTAGCGSGDGGNSAVAPASFTFGGSVGDGPVANSDITIKDASGSVIATSTSDNFANYQITLSAPPSLPITIESSLGTDLVTGFAPTFRMKSVVMNAGQTTANINPHSTMIINVASNMPGGLTAGNLNTARTTVLGQLGFGLNTQSIPDPVTTSVGPQNVAIIVKASESIAEMIRRTRQNLLVAGVNYTEDFIIATMSGDLTDGVLDGNGPNADKRVAATANIVSAQVLLESMTNQLEVDGTSATSRMDNAISTINPSATVFTGDVRITQAMIDQAKVAVTAAQTISPSSALTSVASALDSLAANRLPGQVASALPASSSNSIAQPLLDLVTADDAMLNAINGNGGGGNPPPAGDLTITNTTPANYVWGNMANGASVYTDRDFTFTNVPANYTGLDYLRTANDDKSSAGNAFVSFVVSRDVTVYVGLDTFVNPVPTWLNSWTNTGDVIDAQTTFRIYTKDFAAGTVTLGGNQGDGSSSMYTVMVDSGSGGTPPPTSPTVSLSANPGSVDYNGTATLNWSSTNATSCSASGNWSGGRGTSGIQTTGALTTDSSYTLTCTGAGGTAQDTVTISVAAPPVQTPTVSLTATPASVNLNDSTTLGWSSSNVDSCTASNGWSGSKGTSGSQSSGALTSDTTFTISCSGPNGNASQSVTVTVITPPPPAPTVSLTASPSVVAFNGTTTLSWSAGNANTCTASGGWSGNRNSSSGSRTSVALTADTLFTLNCTGPGGSASDSVLVSVQQPVTGSAALSWTPPTTNQDGSALSDLAGYEIHHGTSPGNYTNPIVVNNPGIAAYVVDGLQQGTHYFSVRAFDTSGNRSGYSNEASKTIN